MSDPRSSFERRYPELIKFLGPYFHQDWRDWYEFPDEAVSQALDSTRYDWRRLAEEIESVTEAYESAEPLSEDLQAAGIDLDFAGYGLAFPEWLNWLKRRVTEPYRHG